MVEDYLRELTDERFRARDEALRVALRAMDKRLDGMNEFRDALKDQTNRFMFREEYQAAHAPLITDIRKLELQASQKAGRDETLAAFDRMDARLKAAESKLATWDGRLWALGTLFLLVNLFVSWWLSGLRAH